MSQVVQSSVVTDVDARGVGLDGVTEKVDTSGCIQGYVFTLRVTHETGSNGIV